MYYNLQETPHMWPLSSIRGFPCHWCLDGLDPLFTKHMSAAHYGSDTATLVFIPAAPQHVRILEVAIYAALLKIYAYVSFD